MKEPKNPYNGDQYDNVEKLMDDAERLIIDPKTRQEGLNLLTVARTRIQRERNRIAYAALTKQRPNIPSLEPSPVTKQLPN